MKDPLCALQTKLNLKTTAKNKHTKHKIIIHETNER